jgi:hypothetical protein
MSSARVGVSGRTPDHALVLERGPPRHEVLPARLIVRGSTGPDPTDAHLSRPDS